MPTATNVVAIKKALVAVLAAAEALRDVQVAYSYPGHDPQREIVHLGRGEGAQSYPTYGGGRARHSRDEEVTVDLFIVVSKPNTSCEDLEDRAVEIGTVVEEIVAAATLTGVTGLIYGGITAFDLDSDDDDDGSHAVLNYRITYNSRLT